MKLWGPVTRELGVLAIAASIAGAGSIAGVLSTEIPLIGSLNGTATVAGTLEAPSARVAAGYAVQRPHRRPAPRRHQPLVWGSTYRIEGATAAALEGSITGTATVTGSMEVPGVPTLLQQRRITIRRSLRPPRTRLRFSFSERSWGPIEAGNPPNTGSITGTSTIAGDLTTAIPLAGDLRGLFPTISPARRASTHRRVWTQPSRQQPAIAGALTTEIPLSGALAGTATVQAPLSTALSLVGSVAGTATATGTTLDVDRTLEAAILGSSTATADGLTGNAAELEASLQGQASIVASLTTAIPLDAATSAQATVAAVLSTDILCVGSLAGQGTITGSLTTDVTFAGTVSGTATASGSLSTEIPCTAVIAGTATAAGELSTEIPLSASINGTSTATAVAEIAFDGAASGASTATASTLDTAIPLSGSCAGTATLAGELSISVDLVGSLTGQGSATASTLATAIPLLGSLAGEATCDGTVTSAAVIVGAGIDLTLPIANNVVLRPDPLSESVTVPCAEPQEAVTLTVACADAVAVTVEV